MKKVMEVKSMEDMSCRRNFSRGSPGNVQGKFCKVTLKCIDFSAVNLTIA